MNNRSDELFDSRLAEWLEDGPDRAPSFVLATLDKALPSIPQRHSWRVFWRSPSMSLPKLIGFVAVAALVLVVGFGAISLFTGGRPFLGGTTATQSPSPTQTAPPLPTPSPATQAPTVTVTPPATPAALTISTTDVGRSLQAGTYRVNDFAAPFAISLPNGWKATEFTPNSVGLAMGSNGSINVYLAIMDKVYADPCHRADGPDVVGPAVDDLVAALSSMTGFDVTNVTDVTVGGATGKQFRITNSIDTAQANCSGDSLAIGTYDKAGAATDIAMFGGETDTFWVLDAGGTRVFMAVTDNAVAATKGVRDTLSFGDAPSN